MTGELFHALDHGATLVTSNHRLARTLSREYSLEKQRLHARVWTEPYIVPWFGWLERCWREILYSGDDPLSAPLNAFQEEMLWEQSVLSTPEAEDLLQPSAAAQAARRAWTLVHAWRLPTGGAVWEGSADCTAFQRWSRGFQERCKASGRMDPAVLADLLRPRLKRPKTVWFAGFDEFTAQQRDMIEALEQSGVDVVRLEPPREPQGAASLAAFPDSESELEAAAAWARGLLLRYPRCRIGVIVPGIRDVRRLAWRTFGGHLGKAVHISGGEPLPDCPAIHVALHLLQLVKPVVPLAVLATILLSPFLEGAGEEAGPRAGFDAWLRSRGRLEWSWRAARRQDRCPAGIGRMFGTWELTADSMPERQPPSAWAKTFSRILRAFGWTGGTELIARAWDRVLSLFSSLDISAGNINAGRALGLISRIAARSSAEDEGSGEPVQVLNLAEASGIEFDHLWIAGLDDTAWPRPAAPNPFLPIPLQRERNLPRSSPSRELVQARLITQQLLAAAPDIVVSYSGGTGERKRGPSPLVAHLSEHEWTNGVRGIEPAPVETLAEIGAPALPEGTAHGGGTRTLQLQASCPFRAFAEIRLFAKPLEEPELGIDPREKGQVLHAALEILLRDFGGSAGLRACPDSDLAARVEKAVGTALREIRGFAGTPFEERLRDLERRRLTRLLTEWLVLEKSRTGEFTVDGLEVEREVEIGGLRLRTRVDRVDRVPAGLVLLDYKSGEPSVKSWEGDRPDEPQLPLYAVTQAEPVAAVAFAQIRTGALRFKGYSPADAPLPGVKLKPVSELVNGWREVLGKLAEGFREGRSFVHPKSPAECEYCHLHSLCRIADQPREVPE